MMLMDEGDNQEENQGQSQNEIAPVSWSASEYINHEKSSTWHGILFVSAGAITFIVFLISRDILASIVILLSATAMSVYARKQPQTKLYSLDDQGVSVDGRSYPYSMFKSFSVVEEGSINSIWLKPIQRLSPTTVIYFPPDEGDNITELLSYFLPFEEKGLDTIDRLTKRIRF